MIDNYNNDDFQTLLNEIGKDPVEPKLDNPTKEFVEKLRTISDKDIKEINKLLEQEYEEILKRYKAKSKCR